MKNPFQVKFKTLSVMKVGDISEPIERQGILFLKLLNTRTVGGNDLNRDIIKKLIDEKKMSYLIYILK